MVIVTKVKEITEASSSVGLLLATAVRMEKKFCTFALTWLEGEGMTLFEL